MFYLWGDRPFVPGLAKRGGGIAERELPERVGRFKKDTAPEVFIPLPVSCGCIDGNHLRGGASEASALGSLDLV